MRTLDRKKIDDIVHYESHLPDIASFDPVFRHEMLAKHPAIAKDRTLDFYWGWDNFKMALQRDEEDRQSRASGHPRDTIGIPVPLEVIAGYGWCVSQSTALWREVEDRRKVEEIELSLPPDESIGRYEDLNPGFGIISYGETKSLGYKYRQYFRLKYAPDSDGDAFSRALFALTKSGPIGPKYSESDFLNETANYSPHQQIMI